MATILRLRAALLAIVTCLALAACAGDGTTVSIDTTVEDREPPAGGEPPSADADADADVEGQMERLVFDLVNEERRARGLEPLEWDDQLADRAREWSRRMAEQGSLEHQDAREMLERAEGFTGVGENVFRATGPVPASTVHVRWMRSDGHRANVLRPQFDRLGVGFVCTDDGELYATQRFGRAGAPATSGPDEEIPPEEPIVAEEGQGPSCPRG